MSGEDDGMWYFFGVRKAKSDQSWLEREWKWVQTTGTVTLSMGFAEKHDINQALDRGRGRVKTVLHIYVCF